MFAERTLAFPKFTHLLFEGDIASGTEKAQALQMGFQAHTQPNKVRAVMPYLLCSSHNQRARRGGNPSALAIIFIKLVEQKIESKRRL